MKTVAILHGWSEGRWHTKKLVKELEKLEFAVIKDVKKADIIIAHSLGVLEIPENVAAELIMLIGVPFWPGKKISKAFRENLRHEAGMRHGFLWWVRRSCWATLYATRRIFKNWRLLKRRVKKEYKLPKIAKTRKVVMIRNELDSFMHPETHNLLPEAKGFKLVKIPGGHEDWWINPKRYVELLLKHL